MRGHIRKRSKGSWSIVLYLGTKANGKPEYQWSTVKGNKRDAERELNRLLHEMDTGTYVEPTKLTVEKYLERWLSDYAKVKVSAKTYERYAEIIRGSIIPSIGHIQINKLRPLHIQKHYSDALTHGRKDGKGGLSPQTVLSHHRILHRALKQAVLWQIIAVNPSDAVQPPRVERKEMHVLSSDQIHTLIEVCEGTLFYMPVVLAISTGMRRGEILGLRWQDIGPDMNSLCIRRSLQETKDGLSFKEPKTAKARRVVLLPAMAIEALKHQKAEQDSIKEKFGPDYSDNDLVCAMPDGSPIRPKYISDNLRWRLAKAGLPAVRFHDLRHSHATILLGQGVHPKVVSERLGHSTISITMDTYSHVLPSIQEEAVRRLNDALGHSTEGSP